MDSESLRESKNNPKPIDLPKVQPSFISVEKNKHCIRITNQMDSPKSTFKESLKHIKIEPLDKTSTLHYFPQQASVSSPKFFKETTEKIVFSNSTSKKSEYESWKAEELRKLHDDKSKKDVTKFLILKDRRTRKMNSLDTNKTTKSSLTNINFNKLNKSKLETLPKPAVSQDQLKENLREFIGAKKYPLDYREVNFTPPKTNFVRFEPLKTSTLTSMKINYDIKSVFKDQLQENFHNSQSGYNKTSAPRRDMIGLAQWLDRASSEIFAIENLSTEEQLLNVQRIYTVCIEEIVEIISKECLERGSILKNIWNIHISLVNACLNRLEKEKDSNYTVFLGEIEKIKESYSSCFDNLLKDNKEKTTLLEDRDFLIKKLTHDNAHHKRKELRLEKTIQILGDGITELKDMFDNVLSENIKLKLTKEEDHSFRKGEREILKKQYDSLMKNRTKDNKKEMDLKIEKMLAVSQNSLILHTPSKEPASRGSKNFSFVETELNVEGSISTLKEILLKDIEEVNDEKLDESDNEDDLNELFVKSVGVDTMDLLPVNNKETTTKDLARYYTREESAQTVYFDEINEENEAGNPNKTPLNSEPSQPNSPVLGKRNSSVMSSENMLMLQSVVESTSRKPSRAIDKEAFIKKRMFSFSAESLHHLDVFKAVESYTLTGVCDWYSTEMETFFTFLRNLTDNGGNENFYQTLEQFDWLNLGLKFKNISMIHEQFLISIKNRDNTRSKEILQHKIDLLERKIEMDEAEKMRNLFKNNYNKLRDKFEQFYKMTIKIQTMDEEEHTQTTITPILKLPEHSKTFKGNRTNMKSSMKSMTMLPKEELLEMSQKHEQTLIEPKTKKNKPKNELQVNIPAISIKVNEQGNINSGMAKSQISITKIDDSPENRRKSPTLQQKPIAEFLNVKSRVSIQISPMELGRSYNELSLVEDLAKDTPKSSKPQNYNRKKNNVDFMLTSTLPKSNTGFSIEEVRETLHLIDKEKSEVIKLEEKKLKEQHDFKELMANEKMIDLINQAHNVLPQKKSWDKLNSLNSDKCYAFLHRIEVSEILPSKNVTLSTILKIISQVLTELIKLRHKKQGNVNPLFFILYEFLMQRYGNIRDRVEEKILKLIQGCKSYLDLPRVKNFAKLLGILNDNGNRLYSTYDGNDLGFYLDFFMQLDDYPMSNIPGVMLAMSPAERAFTGLAKCIDVFNKFCVNQGNIISKAKQEAIVNQIKAIKLDDPIISRKYVVDVDFVIDKLFEIRDEAFKIYITPFLAVDVDYNEALNINEFMLLMRNIEKNKFSDKKITEIFSNEYDFFDEEQEEKCMSFKRFAFVCKKENIITQKRQEEFLQQITDDIKNMKELKDDWEVKKNLIKLKLIKTNYYNSFYVKVVKIIEGFLKSNNTGEEDARVNWFRYRIMDEESNALLLHYETESCLPKEFNLISMKAGELL